MLPAPRDHQRRDLAGRRFNEHLAELLVDRSEDHWVGGSKGASE